MADTADIDGAIAMIASDSNSMDTVIRNVRENPETIAGIMSSMNLDPSIKNRAISAVMSNPDVMREALTMTTRQRAEMKHGMKMSQASARKDMISCVRITQNGIPKKFMMKGDFPHGTIFETGVTYSIGEDLCVFTTTSSRQKNAVATQMIGDQVFGEIVMCKQCPDTGRYLEYAVSDAQCLKERTARVK